MVSWVCRTPLGIPVVPEVYITIFTASGTCRGQGTAPPPAASSSKARALPSGPEARATITWARSGNCGFRRCSIAA